MPLPLVHEGKYGRVTLDLAACGSGFVVELHAHIRPRWATFQQYHAALAFFWALSGRHEAPEAGRGVKGSRNAVRTTLDAPEASKLLASLP